MSSLEAHSVACWRTQRLHSCATHHQGKQLSGSGVDRKLGKSQGQPAGLRTNIYMGPECCQISLPRATPSPSAWIRGGWSNSFLTLHHHAAPS